MPNISTIRSAPRAVSALAALALISAGLATTAAQAQPVIFSWGPSPGYGYYPPAPVYRPVAPRYMPVPVYPGDDYEPAPMARPLSAPQVRERLRLRGLQVIGTPTRNGRVYVADVRDARGIQQRLIVDGFHGQILQTFPPTAARAPQAPGPRYAARPVPGLDTDVIPGGATDPTVIPGIGADPVKPRNNVQQQKKKPAPRVAARPSQQPGRTAPSAIPATPAPAAVAPTTPAIQNALPQAPASAEPAQPPAAALPPQVPAAPAVIPAPAPSPAMPEPVPAPTPATPAPEAVLTPATPAQPTAPATPGTDNAPATGQTTPADAAPADRPRRRVRFIKPESQAVPNPNVPGGQIVPIPEAAPVDVAPRSAAASTPPKATQGDSAPSAPAAVAPLE